MNLVGILVILFITLQVGSIIWLMAMVLAIYQDIRSKHNGLSRAMVLLFSAGIPKFLWIIVVIRYGNDFFPWQVFILLLMIGLVFQVVEAVAQTVFMWELWKSEIKVKVKRWLTQ